MSEEIKEILYLQNYIDKYKSDEKAIIKGNRLTTPAMLDYLEVKALLNCITNLQQKVEQLENIIDVKKYDYDYLETLFSKSSKEEVLRAYTYKCEQLEKVTEARNEFGMKSMQLENIRKEAIEYVNKMWLAKLTPGTVSDTKFDLLNILIKGE